MFQTSMTTSELLKGEQNKVTEDALRTLTLEKLNERAITPVLMQGLPYEPEIAFLDATAIKSMLERGQALNEIWIGDIQKWHLDPLGLGDRDRFMALDERQVADILSKNENAADGTKQILDTAKWTLQQQPSGRHQVYVVAATLQAPVGYKDSAANAVSYQMSADYSGSPGYPNNSRVTYTKESGSLTQLDPDQITKVVGGGLLETFAVGGTAPATAAGQPGQDPTNSIRAGLPLAPLSLVDVMAMSSYALASGWANSIALEADEYAIKHEYWPVTLPPSDPTSATASALGQKHQQLTGPLGGTTYSFGDGGDLENMAFIQMLQRGATRAAVFDSASTPLGASKQKDPRNVLPGEKLKYVRHDLCNSSYVLKASDMEYTTNALFGYGKDTCIDLVHTDAEFLNDTIPFCGFYSNNQVFDKAALKPLACTMQKLRDEGKPIVVNTTLTTVANSWWGIEAGRKVTMVFFYNEVSTDFEALLPTAMQELILARRGAYWWDAGGSQSEAGMDNSKPPAAAVPGKWPTADMKTAFYAQGKPIDYPFMRDLLWGAPVPATNLIALQTQYAVDQNIELYRSIFTG